jgi:hypothetical protein
MAVELYFRWIEEAAQTEMTGTGGAESYQAHSIQKMIQANPRSIRSGSRAMK